MEKINIDKPSVNGRFQIRISEIKELKIRFNEINDNEISNVDFLDDNGLPIQIDQKNINDWKLTGLNITDFIDSNFYIDGFEIEENKNEIELALTYYCQLGGCSERAVVWQGALCVCEKHK